MMKKLNFLSIPSVGSRKRPFSYRSRINPVLIPYRSRIVLLSFSYRSRFRKRKQYVSDAGLIRGRQEEQGRNKGETSPLASNIADSQPLLL